MRFLLLGGTGQVGEEFRALPLPKDVEVCGAKTGRKFDLQDPRRSHESSQPSPGARSSMRPPIPTSTAPKARKRLRSRSTPRRRRDLRPRPGAAGSRSFISRPIMCSTAIRAGASALMAKASASSLSAPSTFV